MTQSQPVLLETESQTESINIKVEDHIKSLTLPEQKRRSELTTQAIRELKPYSELPVEFREGKFTHKIEMSFNQFVDLYRKKHNSEWGFCVEEDQIPKMEFNVSEAGEIELKVQNLAFRDKIIDLEFTPLIMDSKTKTVHMGVSQIISEEIFTAFGHIIKFANFVNDATNLELRKSLLEAFGRSFVLLELRLSAHFNLSGYGTIPEKGTLGRATEMLAQNIKVSVHMINRIPTINEADYNERLEKEKQDRRISQEYSSLFKEHRDKMSSRGITSADHLGILIRSDRSGSLKSWIKTLEKTKK